MIEHKVEGVLECVWLTKRRKRQKRKTLDEKRIRKKWKSIN